jgi:DeoR/GlpR family transcriptional regulator of sugar metabolism
MIKAERHDLIMAELSRRGAVGVQDLARLLDVSSATVRRDISELDDTGLLLRTHGGAAQRDRRHREVSYDAKVLAFLPEKRRIGAHAASLLRSDMTIGCGGGTTVMQMIASVKRKQLRVLTTAVNVALELRDAEDIAVTLTGGTMRKRTAETVGHVCERTIRDFQLDVAIIGTDGIHPEHGLTTYDTEEAYTNRVLIGQAQELWVLADHSKLGEVRPAVIETIERATLLVTDDAAPSDLVAALQAKGVRVAVV